MWPIKWNPWSECAQKTIWCSLSQKDNILAFFLASNLILETLGSKWDNKWVVYWSEVYNKIRLLPTSFKMHYQVDWNPVVCLFTNKVSYIFEYPWSLRNGVIQRSSSDMVRNIMKLECYGCQHSNGKKHRLVLLLKFMSHGDEWGL